MIQARQTEVAFRQGVPPPTVGRDREGSRGRLLDFPGSTLSDVLLDGEAERAALALADELCEFTPFGVLATKQVMWASLDVPNLEAAIQLENRNQVMAGMSGEPEEAARAFFEKRKPRWSQDSIARGDSRDAPADCSEQERDDQRIDRRNL